MEANRKTVNSIYLDSWHKCNFEFLPTDSAVLLAVALQEPLYGGDAVYSARVMLGLDPIGGIILRQQNTEESLHQSKQEFACKIYPVPASDHLAIEHAEFEDAASSLHLEIYSLMGFKTGTYVLDPKSILHRLDISGLKNGVYFCRILQDHKVVFTGKLIVIK